jgi:hypothetical protein
MNLTPGSFAEICKQSAFISALVSGFSFAFLGVMLVSSGKKTIINLVIIFSVIAIAGLLICSLAWTLSASRMALMMDNQVSQVPGSILGIHKFLSVIFILCFFFFLLTLGLSGWIRSRWMGIVTSLICLITIIGFIIIMRQFIV